MPKVVSYDNRVLTNASRNLRDQRFHVFCCRRCLTHITITDAVVADLPRRRTDGSAVLDSTKSVVRLNTIPHIKPVKLYRAGGVETQYHHACPTCSQVVAYQCVPHTCTKSKLQQQQAQQQQNVTTKSSSSSSSSSTSSSVDVTAAVCSLASSSASNEVVGVVPPTLPSQPLLTEETTTLLSSSLTSPLTSSSSSSSSNIDGTTSLLITNTSPAPIIASTPPPPSLPSSSSSSKLTPPPPPRPPTHSTSPSPSPPPPGGGRLLVYLLNDNVLWPKYRPKTPWICRICGYVCKDAQQLEIHKKQRGHEKQEDGTFKLPGEDGKDGGGGDYVMPPVIVG
eukprot:GHVS01004984.1.p1 GENE.GHVS01004984.1~~GHVS01004984.1.p1  ORF type:complete len:337 (+),score=100.75 GHVS01004984.1:43-1053(+)